MYNIILISVLVTLHIQGLLCAPEIILPDGPIKGREATTYSKKTFYSFEKIPFASPPVGKLRFQAPIKPAKWTAVRDATNADVECIQRGDGLNQKEDCLYLNVYTPQLPAEDKNVSLPVMIYIHGGGFIGGTGRTIKSDRIVDEDIILVGINYRLGPFGFLSTQDDVIPGNNGLKDQQFAIQWVHDNIKYFGGDPDKVTIFGQSAGSASCAYQLLNQNNKGFFAGAILESGAALSPWAFQRRAKDIAFDTAAFINSTFKTNKNSKDLLNFLLTVDAKQLNQAASKYQSGEDNPNDREILQGFYWAPVVEAKNPDAFLTRKMYALLEAGNVVGAKVLSGMTSEECLGFYPNSNSLKSDLTAYDTHLDWLVPNDIGVTAQAKRSKIGSDIRDIYTKGQPLASQLGDGLRYLSDTAFTRSIIKEAELYSKIADNYFYVYTYAGQGGFPSVHYDGAESVSHGAELAYITCGTGSGCNFNQAEKAVGERLIKLWTNFAKYQNPTPSKDPLLQNIVWPLVDTKDGDFYYVDIGKDLVIKNHPKEATYGKWVDIYDAEDATQFDTY